MKKAIDLEPKYTLYLPYDEERNIGTCNDVEYSNAKPKFPNKQPLISKTI